jgi:hypothetical protein
MVAFVTIPIAPLSKLGASGRKPDKNFVDGQAAIPSS